MVPNVDMEMHRCIDKKLVSQSVDMSIDMTIIKCSMTMKIKTLCLLSENFEEL